VVIRARPRPETRIAPARRSWARGGSDASLARVLSGGASTVRVRRVDLCYDFALRGRYPVFGGDIGRLARVPNAIEFELGLLRHAKSLPQEEFAHEIEVTVKTVSGCEKGDPVRAQREPLLSMATVAGIEVPAASASTRPVPSSSGEHS
jgi:DNA-binding XRE family transcriptional regulator